MVIYILLLCIDAGQICTCIMMAGLTFIFILCLILIWYNQYRE